MCIFCGILILSTRACSIAMLFLSISTTSIFTTGTSAYFCIKVGRKFPTPTDGSKISRIVYSFASGSLLIIVKQVSCLV